MRNKKNRRFRTLWFRRLKVQFILAIVVSFFIATAVTILILSLSSDPIEKYLFERVDYDRVRLNTAYMQMEKLIVDSNLHPDNVDELHAIFERYSDFVFQLYVAEKGGNNTEVINEFIIYSDGSSSIESMYFENDYGLFIINSSVNQLNTYASIMFFAVLTLFVGVFVACIIFFVGRKQKYLLEIENGLEILAGGELTHRIKLRGKDEVTSVAGNINLMSQALKDKIDQEKETEATKQELIANVSHDLRTPLTSIIGFMSLLRDVEDKNNEMANEYIDVALKKSTELSALIEQLFDYVMFSNHQKTLKCEEVDMTMVMHQNCFECRSLLEEQGFKVVVDIEDKAAPVYIDSALIMRVLDNLIQNVNKYADITKPILINGFSNNGYYEIHLVNGLKANASISDDVFTRYFTSDRANDKSIGLGLAICREIIQLHNGEIDANISDALFEIVVKLPIGGIVHGQ